jgi:hypothetical protein
MNATAEGVNRDAARSVYSRLRDILEWLERPTSNTTAEIENTIHVRRGGGKSGVAWPYGNAKV